MDSKPRILYVWDADYPWDVRTEKVCRTLVEAGFAVGIAARNRARAVEREPLPEGLVMRMPPVPWLGPRLDAATGFPAFLNPRWISHLGSCASDLGADLIMVRDLPLCPTAIWEARRRGIPVILDMAENYPAMIEDIWLSGRQRPWDLLARNPAAVRAVERYCLRRVDEVLVVVEESGTRLERSGVEPARITVVSNTPPRSRALLPRADRENGPLTLVYLGIMEVPRGVLEVIEAAAILRPALPGLRVDLIGDGRDRTLFEVRAGALGLLDGTISFLGYLPNREALERVARADIGLVPHHANESWNTTIPNKLFDYMSAGLPVVTSDAVPAARIVRETGSGETFRSGSAAGCARAIAALAPPDRRQAAAEAGRRAVVSRYHWERDAERLVEAVHRALAARRGGR